MSYLQVKTDGHQDLVGVVSGQEGHKHILQENNSFTVSRFICVLSMCVTDLNNVL